MVISNPGEFLHPLRLSYIVLGLVRYVISAALKSAEEMHSRSHTGECAPLNFALMLKNTEFKTNLQIFGVTQAIMIPLAFFLLLGIKRHSRSEQRSLKVL